MDDIINPFDNNFDTGKKPSIIHIHIKQRTARQKMTVVTGLPDSINKKEFLRTIKKRFCCNGSVQDHEFTFTGDQRDPISKFLIAEGLAVKDNIIIHGY